MDSLHYTVILEREEDGGYHASCPTLKGCHSQGDTLDEAIDNIREAIAAYLDSLKAEGEAIPIEDTGINAEEFGKLLLN
jgi:predicted RNase H-like HicB family nuclease